MMGTVAIQTLVTAIAVEPEDQPVTVLIAPIQKMKCTKKTVRVVRDDDEPRPSQEQEEEAEPEIITRSLSLSEL